jgi:hypothetical protein
MTYEEFVGKINAPKVKRPKRSLFGVEQPQNLNIDACIDVLEGNTDRLLESFHWSSTPQGNSYWDDRYEGYENLNRADEEYIQSLIDIFG